MSRPNINSRVINLKNKQKKVAVDYQKGLISREDIPKIMARFNSLLTRLDHWERYKEERRAFLAQQANKFAKVENLIDSGNDRFIAIATGRMKDTNILTRVGFTIFENGKMVTCRILDTQSYDSSFSTPDFVEASYGMTVSEIQETMLEIVKNCNLMIFNLGYFDCPPLDFTKEKTGLSTFSVGYSAELWYKDTPSLEEMFNDYFPGEETYFGNKGFNSLAIMRIFYAMFNDPRIPGLVIKP